MHGSNEQATRILQRVLAHAAVRPSVQSALTSLPWEPALVLGGGKAARPMAEAVLERFPRAKGALAAPPEHAGKLGEIEFIAAGHPLPDAGSVQAVRRQEELLASSDGPCLFLLSGGASALLGAPAGEISIGQLRDVYDALLRSGLDIQAMNLIRRHLTRWGGGKFLRYVGSRDVRALVVSDVLDDDLTVIGSGPTVPDATTLDQARALLHGLHAEFTQLLEERMQIGETVKPGAPAALQVTTQIVLSNQTVVTNVAQEMGAKVLASQTADVAEVAEIWASVLSGEPGIYVAGGESTVTIPKNAYGRGGRNQHLVAEIARRNPRGNWLFLSIATDGMDGNSGNAGAWIDSVRARVAEGVEEALRSFNTATWCEREGVAFKTGPTGTNIADIQIAIVLPAASTPLNSN